MAVDTLNGQIAVKSRDEIVANYLRDYALRDPGANLADGEQPDIDAKVLADQLLPIYAAARNAGNATSGLNQTGDDIDKYWEPRGLPRLKAVGSSGYVTIKANSTGGPIFAGDECKDEKSGLRFQCLETRLDWQDGDIVAIGGIDTGPQTDLDPGTVLKWSEQRPGIGSTATVYEQPNGDGLTGGRDKEGNEEYKRRTESYQANPAASGNDAEVQLETERTPGVAVEKCFTYPAILACGTSAVAFTMKPRRAGASRIPSELQRQAVETYITGLFPKDHIYLFPTLFAENVDVSLEVRWAKRAIGWQDTVTWPARYAPTDGRIQVSAVTSATAFTLVADDADYTGVASPVTGQTIAFFDSTRRRFSRKRIATVTGTGPWAITVDTANAASDTIFTPVVGQPACPFSESLDALVPLLLEVFAKLGPGEMVDNVDFLLDGQRQRRMPEDPGDWPASLTAKALNPVLDAPEISTGSFFDGVDTTPTVGVPGVTLYMLALRYFTVFPKVS